MKKSIIAPVGYNIDALFVGMGEFPTQRVYLFVTKDRMHLAKRAKKDLERFKVDTKMVEVKGES